MWDCRKQQERDHKTLPDNKVKYSCNWLEGFSCYEPTWGIAMKYYLADGKKLDFEDQAFVNGCRAREKYYAAKYIADDVVDSPEKVAERYERIKPYDLLDLKFLYPEEYYPSFKNKK